MTGEGRKAFALLLLASSHQKSMALEHQFHSPWITVVSRENPADSADRTMSHFVLDNATHDE